MLTYMMTFISYIFSIFIYINIILLFQTHTNVLHISSMNCQCYSQSVKVLTRKCYKQPCSKLLTYIEGRLYTRLEHT